MCGAGSPPCATLRAPTSSFAREAEAMETSRAEIDALRTALLQRARELGLLAESVTPSDEEMDGLLDVLLAREARVPSPTAGECRRYYDANAARFTAGEIVEASHILIAVTPGCD